MKQRLILIWASSLLCFQMSVGRATPAIDNQDNQIGNSSNQFNFTINKTVDDYLENVTRSRLLLPCGHQPQDDEYYSTGLNGTGDIHKHEEWYTVDIDPKIEPDLICDLNNQDHINYFFRDNTWDIIYFENISFGHLNHNFIEKAFDSLKQNGALIFFPSVGNEFTLTEINDPKKKYVIEDRFKYSNMIPAIYEYYGSLREGSYSIQSAEHTFYFTPFNSLENFESYFKSYLVNKVGFREIKLFSDTIFRDQHDAIDSCIGEMKKAITNNDASIFDAVSNALQNFCSNISIDNPDLGEFTEVSENYYKFPIALVELDHKFIDFAPPPQYIICTK